MDINDFEWKIENEWPELVLKESQRNLEEKLDYNDKLAIDITVVERFDTTLG